jgi:hypothetical protein
VALNENNAPDAFGGFAAALRRALLPAIVDPLVDTHPPDDIDDGAYQGSVASWHGQSALVQPAGDWKVDYTGIIPVSQQPQIKTPEPWETGGF